MKKFFKNHPETLLIILAIFFVMVIAMSFVFGIKTVIVSLNNAVGLGGKGTNSANFDIKGAAALDLKGLVK
ncbi:MAG: hypothetical protein KGJ89_04265 [Patescibacteria group bacterium]|nr:hypothetical protein [Patescibacteria group bacterium]MDE2015337.1 hypothetical protein [Patescibacteria group bacterium]MDE2227142.1 hypothetical protein [Patescibacteria group bacterium]